MRCVIPSASVTRDPSTIGWFFCTHMNFAPRSSRFTSDETPRASRIVVEPTRAGARILEFAPVGSSPALRLRRGVWRYFIHTTPVWTSIATRWLPAHDWSGTAMESGTWRLSAPRPWNWDAWSAYFGESAQAQDRLTRASFVPLLAMQVLIYGRASCHSSNRGPTN
jgi:hypothetical protein